jgi:hypothetical protein
MSADKNLKKSGSDVMNTDSYELLWKKPVIKIGMITMLIASALSFIPLIYLYIKYGIMINLATALKAWGLIVAVFGAFYIVEPISYYPILGLAGTYMSFLSGNISNLRLPCSAMAQEVVGAKEGTREAEIIGTMGIVGSIVVNLIGVTLAAFIGNWILGLLPEIVATAFRDYTAPAIFGAVFGQFSMRQPKLAPFALAIPLILLGVLKAPIWLVILASVFGTIIISRFFYKAGIIK